MTGRASDRTSGQGPGQIRAQAPTTSLTRGELRAIRARAANRNGPRRIRPLRTLAGAMVVAGGLGVACSLGLQAAGFSAADLPEGFEVLAGQGFLIASILATSLGASLRTVLKA